MHLSTCIYTIYCVQKFTVFIHYFYFFFTLLYFSYLHHRRPCTNLSTATAAVARAQRFQASRGQLLRAAFALPIAPSSASASGKTGAKQWPLPRLPPLLYRVRTADIRRQLFEAPNKNVNTCVYPFFSPVLTVNNGGGTKLRVNNASQDIREQSWSHEPLTVFIKIQCHCALGPCIERKYAPHPVYTVPFTVIPNIVDRTEPTQCPYRNRTAVALSQINQPFQNIHFTHRFLFVFRLLLYAYTYNKRRTIRFVKRDFIELLIFDL